MNGCSHRNALEDVRVDAGHIGALLNGLLDAIKAEIRTCLPGGIIDAIISYRCDALRTPKTWQQWILT